MKIFMLILIVFFTLISNINGQNNRYCVKSATDFCNVNLQQDFVLCKSVIEGFNHTENSLQKFIDMQLAYSYDYLTVATYFDSYQANRPGFYKLFRKLSDHLFDGAICVIKHLTKRGGNPSLSVYDTKKKSLGQNEIKSLAYLLDAEKVLVHKTQNIQKHSHHDPETAHFIEEHFLTRQTENIRKVTGYANDLSKLIKGSGGDPSLSIYLFDEYLQKM